MAWFNRRRQRIRLAVGIYLVLWLIPLLFGQILITSFAVLPLFWSPGGRADLLAGVAGIPWLRSNCVPEQPAATSHLNRLVQQQQLGIPIARALIYDEICQAVVLSQDDSDELVRMYLDQQGIEANNADASRSFCKPRAGVLTT